MGCFKLTQLYLTQKVTLLENIRILLKTKYSISLNHKSFSFGKVMLSSETMEGVYSGFFLFNVLSLKVEIVHFSCLDLLYLIIIILEES